MMNLPPATYTALALRPEDKAMLLVAESLSKNLEEREKTRIVFKDTVDGLQKANTSQADEIETLKAALEIEKQARAREVAVLKGALSASQAEVVSLKKMHQQDVFKYVAAMKVDAGRIKELSDALDLDRATIARLVKRVDAAAANIQRHRTAMAGLIDHFCYHDRNPQDRKDAYHKARAILN